LGNDVSTVQSHRLERQSNKIAESDQNLDILGGDLSCIQLSIQKDTSVEDQQCNSHGCNKSKKERKKYDKACKS
jgi:hypothetical protein